jgi:uncharacterized protein YacL
VTIWINKLLKYWKEVIAMDKRLQKPLIQSAILVVALIVLLLISNGIGTENRSTLNVIIIIVFIILLAVTWFKYVKEFCTKAAVTQPKEKIVEKKIPPSKEERNEPTRTGKICEKSGTYYCEQHTESTVEMEEGKRFPPCRGDRKGHSAVWHLK